jgi:serine phosphatase RsbU (regulator of sigma subunit)
VVWECAVRSESEFSTSYSSPHKEQAAAFRVLVADDQSDVLEALRLLLKAEGYELELVNSPSAILEALGRREFDLLLMDLNYARDTTSGREGLDLLSQIREIDVMLPIVAMTAWGSIELAVEIMREGVRDFVLKPWDNARLLGIVRKEIERGRRARQARRIEREGQQRNHLAEAGDWEEAQRTQLGFLPREIPQIPGCEISGAWLPIHGIGGDYFDVMQLDEHRFALCIADVAGKGIAAALLMSNLQATVHSLAAQSLEPGELAARVNRVISENTASDRFITFFYGILDARTRRMSYANAGHYAPIIVHPDGTVSRLCAGGQALGISPAEKFEQGDIGLGEGDRMMLFTDGITEVAGGGTEEFGESRLLEILRETRKQSATKIQGEVLCRVAQFSGGKFQDDATLIILAVG